MIIPLSHDSGQVRRQPWVTYGILLSCVLVFLITQFGSGDTAREAELCVEDAYKYWSAHPYLEAAPRLTEITGDPGSASRDEFYAIWEETGEPPVSADSLERDLFPGNTWYAGTLRVPELIYTPASQIVQASLFKK